jgi:hypothetical protein
VGWDSLIRGEKLNTIYQFMDYDPAYPEKPPFLDEEIVK